MKKTILVPLETLAIVLAIPTRCHAHSVHPIFIFGFGPLSLLAAMGSAVGWVAVLAILSIQALILRRFIPGALFLGSLWRAAVIFIASKVAETAPVFIHPDAFMGSCSDAMLALIVTLMFIVGVGVSVLLISLLYWRSRPGRLRVLCLSLVMECTSILGLCLSNIALMEAGINR